MPGFTQEPVIEKPKVFQFFKPNIIIPVLLGLTVLYLIYYFIPSQFTSIIPNPFSKKSTITVLGTGTITAQPDKAIFAVTVAAIDNSSQSALTSAKNKVKSLTNSLKAKGLADADVKIASYNVTPTAVGESLRYAAGTTIIVTSPDLLMADSLVETALSQGARLSVPLTYQVENQSILEQQARDKAIDDARGKAQNVARSFNKQLGKMTSYIENPSTQGSTTTDSSSTSQPGQLDISQTVQVSFKTK